MARKIGGKSKHSRPKAITQSTWTTPGRIVPAWKMAVEIKQIALRDELEHGVLCGLLDQPSARLCSERPLSFKQSDELGIGCFALGVDRQ